MKEDEYEDFIFIQMIQCLSEFEWLLRNLFDTKK